MRRSALFIATLLLTACSALVDLDGLVGAPSGADTGPAAADGTAPSVDASVNDAASPQDVLTPALDGGADSSTAVDAAEAGFCASNPGHSLCDDFNVSPINSQWTHDTAGGPVSIDFTAGDFTSPPASLRAFGDSSGEADLQHVFSATSGAALEGNVIATFTNGATESDVMYTYFPVAGATPYSTCYFDIDIGTALTELEIDCGSSVDAGDSYSNVTIVNGALTGFHHLKMTVDLPNKLVTGSVDGTSKSLSLPAVLTNSTFQVSFGSAYVDQGNVTLHWDDVLVDVH